MKDQIIFVTGGASGIGRSTVSRLASSGARVVSIDRNAEALEASVQTFVAQGHDVRAAVADVCDRAAIAGILDSEARVDTAICVAGIFKTCEFDDLTATQMRQTMEVNLLGVFVMAQEAARRMMPGGRIVVVSSRGALGMQRAADYVASKAAVIGLVRAMAIDLRARGIAVNSVAPGFIDTPMTRSLPPDLHAASVALEPSGAAGSPDDIANAIAFFAAPQTRFVTGQTLVVDGGKSLGGLGV